MVVVTSIATVVPETPCVIAVWIQRIMLMTFEIIHNVYVLLKCNEQRILATAPMAKTPASIIGAVSLSAIPKGYKIAQNTKIPTIAVAQPLPLNVRAFLSKSAPQVFHLTINGKSIANRNTN